MYSSSIAPFRHEGGVEALHEPPNMEVNNIHSLVGKKSLLAAGESASILVEGREAQTNWVTVCNRVQLSLSLSLPPSLHPCQCLLLSHQGLENEWKSLLSLRVMSVMSLQDIDKATSTKQEQQFMKLLCHPTCPASKY